MKTNVVVEMFAEDVNFAVIRVPSRNFPGVLIQGDSLYNLSATLREGIDLLEKDRNDAIYALKYVCEELEWRVKAYEEAVQTNA